MNDAPEYWTTPIIEDPSYIRFSSYWDDLFGTGFLPLAISIFFNLKIYLKVQTLKIQTQNIASIPDNSKDFSD